MSRAADYGCAAPCTCDTMMQDRRSGRRARVPSFVERVLDYPVVREVARSLDRKEVVHGIVRRPRVRRRHAHAAPVAACASRAVSVASTVSASLVVRKRAGLTGALQALVPAPAGAVDLAAEVACRARR